MRSKEEILDGMNKVEFLLRCKTDFKFFCEKMLGIASDGRKIEMKPYQIKWWSLAQTYDRLVIEAAAGFAKSETMGAMYPLWLMFSKRNLRILLVSKTRAQSKGNLLDRIKNYIRDNGFLKELFVPKDAETSWNQNEIITKQGHWVRVVPYSSSIRGYRAHLILCDEADDYDDPNIYFEHVASRVFEGGKIIIISTPASATKLIGQLKEKKQAGKLKNYHFEKTRAMVKQDGSPAYTCKPENVNKEMLLDCVSIWPEGYSNQTLLDKWDEQGRWNFMRNVMCEVIGEVEDAIFKINDVLDAYDYTIGFTDVVDKDTQYFIGADFAISSGPRADFDAFVVVKKKNDQYTLVHAEDHKGWQRPAKVQRLRELWEHYETPMGCVIVADESNMGTMVMNDLRGQGVTVVAQSFHSAARKKLILTLSNVFQGKAIIIPRSIDDHEAYRISELVKDQLVGFKRKTSDKTGVEGIESTCVHDDVAISLAMAVQEGTKHEDMDLSPIW